MTTDRPDERSPADTPTPATPALQYDTRPSPITRRQMNFFLLLLFINTLLFAGFVCLPSASPWLKQTWADFQARRQQKKQAAAAAANLAAAFKDCLAYTMSPDKVVYAEAPADVSKLLASDGRANTLATVPEMITPEGGGIDGAQVRRLFVNLTWQPPAMTQTTPALSALFNALPAENRGFIPAGGATVFLHEMKTPSGQRRLVCVNLHVEQVVIYSRPDDRRSGVGRSGSGGATRYELQTRRALRATVIDPQNPAAAAVTVLLLDDSREIPPPAPQSDSAEAPVKRTIRPGPQWKIFAAQPDPNDSTHFTIRYELDGKPAVIDGRLNDGDRLILTPPTGKLITWNNGYEYTWDINATPATQPATTRPSTISASP
jgi:hypothetical protein